MSNQPAGTARVVEIKGRDTAGKDWSGRYSLVRVEDETVVVSKADGKAVRVPRAWVVGELPGSVGTVLSYEELVADIKKRFDVLDRLTDGVIAGNIHSMIVSGQPGVGKTHNIEAKLSAAVAAGEINRYVVSRGTISPIGLYMLLWQNRRSGDVLLIDDTETVYDSLDTLSILKCGLDTGDRREVTYLKESYALKEQGVPQRFLYEGACIFISNVDFDAAVNSGSKMAPHLNALMSRSIYVSLGLHSTQALMARVESVCRESDMLRSKGLTEDQIDELIDWIKSNQPSLRSLSLRTALQLASLMRTDEDWKAVAKVTMLKTKSK